MAAQDLCTLTDVRQALELPTADTSRDALISTLITQASEVIMGEVDREFAPATTAATRRIRVTDYTPTLAPYDLRSVTAVVLHPETSSPQTLTVTTDYQLLPVGSPSGTYTSIGLSGYLSLVSDSAVRFGYALLDVSGAWGFSSVPPDVVRACVLTVSTWLRRDVTALALLADTGGASGGLAPSYPSSFALPRDVKAILGPWYRLRAMAA